MKGSVFSGQAWPWALAGPQLLLVLLFFYWPAGEALVWSLTLERPFGGPAPFVGLTNFAELFADDVFVRSLASTAIFTGLTTALSVGMALALAVAADRAAGFGRRAEPWLIWPYAVAAPAAGVVMQLVTDPRVGLLAGLNALAPGAWSPATDGAHAMAMVVAAFVWVHAPFNFIFLLAGLRATSRATVEAAAVDGAGAWRQLLDIRLPQIRPYLFFVLFLDVTESFTQSFGIIHATTRGGPGGATNVLVYNIYADGFLGLDFSRAAAQSVLLVATVAVATLGQFRLARREGLGA